MVKAIFNISHISKALSSLRKLLLCMSDWVIIVAPASDSWRLFNPLSACWTQIDFPLFCLAQVRVLRLPLPLTVISRNTTALQKSCQLKVSDISRWGQTVTCQNFMIRESENRWTCRVIGYSGACCCSGCFLKTLGFSNSSVSLTVFLVLVFSA